MLYVYIILPLKLEEMKIRNNWEFYTNTRIQLCRSNLYISVHMCVYTYMQNMYIKYLKCGSELGLKLIKKNLGSFPKMLMVVSACSLPFIFPWCCGLNPMSPACAIPLGYICRLSTLC